MMPDEFCEALIMLTNRYLVNKDGSWRFLNVTVGAHLNVTLIHHSISLLHICDSYDNVPFFGVIFLTRTLTLTITFS